MLIHRRFESLHIDLGSEVANPTVWSDALRRAFPRLRTLVVEKKPLTQPRSAERRDCTTEECEVVYTILCKNRLCSLCTKDINTIICGVRQEATLNSPVNFDTIVCFHISSDTHDFHVKIHNGRVVRLPGEVVDGSFYDVLIIKNKGLFQEAYWDDGVETDTKGWKVLNPDDNNIRELQEMGSEIGI